jgi:hypothetical protein
MILQLLNVVCVCGQVLHAFERWHAQHTVSVRALLEVRNQGSLAGLLAQRLANVVNHLLDFFRLKAAVVSLVQESRCAPE